MQVEQLTSTHELPSQPVWSWNERETERERKIRRRKKKCCVSFFG